MGFTQMPYFGNPGAFYIFLPQYALNIFKQYKKQKSMESLVKAQARVRETVKLSIISQVSTEFFTLIAQQEMLGIYKQLLRDIETDLQLHKALYKHTLIAQDKLEELTSELQQTKSRIEITENNIIISKNALHFLMNQNPGQLTITSHLHDIHTDQITPGNTPVSVLNNRPDIQEHVSLLRAANENIGVASTGLLPTIKINSFLGQGSTVPNPSSSILLAEGYLEQPIVAPTVFGDIKIARAEYKATYTAYINSIRRALRDVENDLSAYNSFRKQLIEHSEAYLHASKECHLTEVRYKYGIDNYVDNVRCKIKLAQFKLQVTQSKLDKILSIIHLYQDLGAGYRVRD